MILLRPADGTMTLVPHKTQPSSEDNSYFNSCNSYSSKSSATRLLHVPEQRIRIKSSLVEHLPSKVEWS